MDTVQPESISPAELNALMARADAPLLLDVRRRARFDASPTMLAGAHYCAPEDVAAFALSNEKRDVIVYCVYGHEVGCDAARTLREAGWNARFLAGGIEGGEPGVDSPQDIAAWRSQPLPTVPKETA
ncbi:rhodanese-like domain-containing protein [Ramlibacter albus]|uniref:Sulfurtransferase n=1 Tax=Ramlibacter albus TaxID=2079448 RepID=A0A923S0Z1_9BURK|nr:rhodanese-like domain-containing protein [Ramlibacter albus]MBC5763731.1 sulfurtransferase [Ramlibacter albus]